MLANEVRRNNHLLLQLDFDRCSNVTALHCIDCATGDNPIRLISVDRAI
jgi:hypothetical protein